jgi:uncharacterized membrane-anchored protein
MHLGFFSAGLLFAVAILAPLAAWRLGANATLCFWAAYVLTRPLGASFADWMGKDRDIGGGLGYGDLQVTGVLVVVIAILVGFVHQARSRDDEHAVTDDEPAGAVRP